MMNTPFTREQVLELLPLYAIGGLETAEQQAVEQYLQTHEQLLTQLAAMDAATVLLAQSAPVAPLPASNRERLMARVYADLAELPRTASADPSLSPTGNNNPLQRGGTTRTTRPAPRTQDESRTVKPGWLWRPALWGAVALGGLLLLIGSTLNTVQLRQEVTTLQAELTTARQRVENLAQINAQLEGQLQQSQNQLANLLAPERSVIMVGTDLAPSAQGAFYLTGDAGTVVVSGLAPLPTDQAYQLWLVPPDGTPTSVGLLEVTGTAPLTATVQVPPELRNFAIVDVSIEPAGGSPNITVETIVLRGAIAQS